jgi:hypothetical protein
MEGLELSNRDSTRSKRLPDNIGELLQCELEAPMTIYKLQPGLVHSDERVRLVQEWLDSEPSALDGEGGRILSPVEAVQLGDGGSLLVHFDISAFEEHGENVFSVLWVSGDRSRAAWTE